MKDRLEAWLDAVDEAEGRFREVASLEELPEHVRKDSEFWCDEILAPAVNPHDVETARHHVFQEPGETPDLVAHDVAVNGTQLRIIEGRNFLLVRVDRRSLDLLALPIEARHAAAERAAEAIFREPLRFRTCAALGEGGLVCTDAEVDPLLISSWSRRAEGGIRGGELWFLCYKKCAQRTGFCNAAQWFSDTGEVRPEKVSGARAARRRTRTRPR